MKTTIYTTQEVINMAADMYDNQGYSRGEIKAWLKALLDSGSAQFDLDRIFDIIC